jgi:hypothetical protein
MLDCCQLYNAAVQQHQSKTSQEFDFVHREVRIARGSRFRNNGTDVPDNEQVVQFDTTCRPK